MSTQSSTSNKNFTRGGQITFHNFRMWSQINFLVFKISALIFLLLSGLILYALTPNEILLSAYNACYAKLALSLSFLDISWKKMTVLYHQKTYVISPLEFFKIPPLMVQAKQIRYYASLSLTISFCLTTALTFCFIVWLKQRGKLQTSNQYIRGAKLAEPEVVAKLIRKQHKASDIVISSVPMIDRFEVQHTLIHGTVGAGKGQTFNQFLSQIKQRGDRAIIYDKGCVFTATFYDSKKDIILNPFDARCANWDLWSEALDGPDFENLAESLIPMHGETDPFWVNAARTIFSSVACTMKDDVDRSIERLLKLILTAELDELAQYLKGTEAATLVSEKIEKTAISIRSVITTYLKSLRFLQGLNQQGQPSFSIRDWIVNAENNGCLFISSNAEQHAALRPLISMWLSMASISLLSLPENYDRRIWFICDELPTLHKLPQLPETISEVRKFGGCFVLGMQSFAQLEKVYGRSAAKEMFDLLNTRFFFRSPSAEMARLVSQELGEQEIDHSRENYSYGANTVRDGISIGSQRMNTPIVTAAEIMSMPDLTAYLRVPADVPVCKLKIHYQSRDKLNDGFIKRDIITDPEIEDCLEAIVSQVNKSGVSTKLSVVTESVVASENKDADTGGCVTPKSHSTLIVDREI